MSSSADMDNNGKYILNSWWRTNTRTGWYHNNSNSEIKDYALCWGNISKDFAIDNTKKITALKGGVNIFSVDFNPIDINNILDIYK